MNRGGPVEPGPSDNFRLPAGLQHLRLRPDEVDLDRAQCVDRQDHPLRLAGGWPAYGPIASRCKSTGCACIAPTSFDAPPAGFASSCRMLSPSDEGGADYATVSGNPWDFTGPTTSSARAISSSTRSTAATWPGVPSRNDSFVELPLRTPLIPDRYHRLTVDVCYDGGFSLADAPAAA